MSLEALVGSQGLPEKWNDIFVRRGMMAD